MSQDDQRLHDLFSTCRGAYAAATMKGYATDLRVFVNWCEARSYEWLPTSPQVLAAFVAAQVEQYTIATIKRRLCAINFAHRFAEQQSPINHGSVQLAVRRAARTKARRPDQARGLTAEILKQILEKCPDTLLGLRDAALISVGYDTLCRSSELAAMRAEHLCGSGPDNFHVLIPRSKGDGAGDGRTAYLSPHTADVLIRWLKIASIAQGPMFRGLHLRRVSGVPLNTSSVRRLVKRAANRAGVREDIAAHLSGHSMRVGAAQDMLVAGFDALAIMQAGGWKSPSVLLRYVENAATRKLHERRWQAVWSNAATVNV